MPTTGFTQQPPRIADTVEIPKTYEHAARLMGNSFHTKISDETWLVKSYRPRGDFIDLVWNGILLVTFDRAAGWLILNTNGFPHYRAVLDIFRRVLSGSLCSIRCSQSDTSDNWTNFNGGQWTIDVHAQNEAGAPVGIRESHPFTDMMALHPATGTVNLEPFANQRAA